MAEAKGNISVARISCGGAAQTLELHLQTKSETVAEGRGSMLNTTEDVGSAVLSLAFGETRTTQCSGAAGHLSPSMGQHLL